MAINTEINEFFNVMNGALSDEIKASDSWIGFCDKTHEMLKDVDDVLPEDGARVPAKHFWKVFKDKIESDAVIALGNSNCVTGIFQYGTAKQAQRVITNINAGSMGYDLPEAVGISVVSGKPVYCVTGDGSIMMNLQELETIAFNNLNIKIVIFSNEGYGAIRQTCKNYFDGNIFGCDEKSGVGLPDFKKIAYAFDFEYMCCETASEMEKKLDELIHTDGRTILEIKQLLDDPVVPKLMSKLREDGVFEAPEFTSFYPFLEEEVSAKLIYKDVE